MKKANYDDKVVIETADGTPFDPECNYFWFDVQSLQVRESGALRRVGDHLGSMGLRIVAIKDLFRDRNAAIDAGEMHLVDEVRKLKDEIRRLEGEKSPERRTLRYLTMARE
jgi:hypothetical protein